jgi:hypothetical protein
MALKTEEMHINTKKACSNTNRVKETRTYQEQTDVLAYNPFITTKVNQLLKFIK